MFVNCGNPDCYHNTELDVSRFPDHLTYKTREFDEPIPVSKDRPLVTLRDAGDHITKLPKVDHTAAEWQAAMEALILVATLGGPTMFARIGVMRALNRHVERVFDPSRKDKHWGRRKLARRAALRPL